MLFRHIGLLVALSLTLPACGREQPSRPSEAGAHDAAPAPAPSAPDAASEARERPAYDEHGVPLPSKRQALGVAVPRGFERMSQDRRTVHYRGPIAPEKVAEFYRRYLDCLDVRQTLRGWRFSKATPRPPGDPSRHVDLTILKVRGGRSSVVVIIDRMGQSKLKIPDGGPETFEELYQEAHKRGGSPSHPIPGTY